MHELAIAESIVEIACRHAAGRKIKKIELKSGALRQIVPAALLFSFELVAQGTMAEGAELEIEFIPARVRCRACNEESRQDSFPLTCAACGGFDLEIIAGDELDVQSLEVAEMESGTIVRGS